MEKTFTLNEKEIRLLVDLMKHGADGTKKNCYELLKLYNKLRIVVDKKK